MAAFMTLLVIPCASAMLEVDRMTPMKKIECARSSRRQLTLEESWSSLSVFNQTQKGRISLDLQGQLWSGSKVVVKVSWPWSVICVQVARSWSRSLGHGQSAVVR